jgi:6-pyruvoyltetrahydropterin/6-carboxytetrahydropterin synthase
MEYMEIIQNFTFDAAHLLPNVPDGHKCKRLHGHTYNFSVHLKVSVITDRAWNDEYLDIKKVVQPFIDSYLDHFYLNDLKGLENPTSENVAIWIWKKLKPEIPPLYKIVVNETCNSACIYSGQNE